jgi:hypothetical protein
LQISPARSNRHAHHLKDMKIRASMGCKPRHACF